MIGKRKASNRKDSAGHNPVNVGKRSLIISIIVISLMVGSLILASIFSTKFAETNLYKTIHADAQKQNCNVQPTFPINPLSYHIAASSLEEAFFNFRFSDAKTGEPQAAETESLPPQFSPPKGILDDKDRIVCFSSVTIPITITMPVWDNVGTLCAPIQSEWSKFLQAVNVHEQRHVDIIKKGYADIVKKIVGKTPEQATNIVTKMGTQIENKHKTIDPPPIKLNFATGKSPGCPCPSGQKACGTHCIDITTNDNCGACGNNCNNLPNPVGSTCQNGLFCQCPEGQVNENGRCVPPICPAGAQANLRIGSQQAEVCRCTDPNQEPINGQCVDKCPSGTTRDPNGQCVTPNNECSPENPSGTCPSGQTCTNGQCIQSCPPGATNDFGLCICPGGQFLSVDGNSCVSSCGPDGVARIQNRGAGFPTCIACPSGTTACPPTGGLDSSCEDLQVSAEHCGACGNACPAQPDNAIPRSCQSGECTGSVCAEGTILCHGLSTNPAGSCFPPGSC